MSNEMIEDAAAAVAAALGSQRVSATCAAALRDLLPGTLFLRASVRCGAGLFVSEDLLQAGYTELSVVSLQNSLAGVAMALCKPVVVSAPTGQAAPTAAQVLCLPVALHQAFPTREDSSNCPSRSTSSGSSAADEPSTGGGSEGGAGPSTDASSSDSSAADAVRPLYVGALMVGAGAGGFPPLLWQQLEQLALAAAPYLLLLSLTKASEMADVLRLRAADCSCCSGEEDALQDVPLEACTPALPPAGGAGGAAGALAASAGGDATTAAVAAPEAVNEQLHAAAAAALAMRSRLLDPGMGAAAAGPAEQAAGASSSQKAAPLGGTGEGKAAGARPLHPGGSSSGGGGQLGLAGREEQGEFEEEEDPKAALQALKLRHQGPEGGSSDGAGGTPTGPLPPTTTLLRYADPALEGRFAAAQNRGLAGDDTLFALMHLAAALCLAALHPHVVGRSPTVLAFIGMLLVPLLARVLGVARYQQFREPMLAGLLVVHALLLRSCTLHSLLNTLPKGALEKLPWLLRATGAEALAVFPLGFKLRFSVFLPVQVLCLALVMSALPAPCHALHSALSCLPERLGRPSTAALLMLGGLLPAAALYKLENRARQRFCAAQRQLGLAT